MRSNHWQNMQNITTTIYERYCTQFSAITKCWKKHRVTKITGSLKPFGIKQLNQLHRGVSDVEAYQQCHHSNILGWVSNPMNSNPNEFGSVRIAWPVWNVAKHDSCGVARWLWLQDFVSLCLTFCHRIEIKILISSPGFDAHNTS